MTGNRQHAGFWNWRPFAHNSIIGRFQRREGNVVSWDGFSVGQVTGGQRQVWNSAEFAAMPIVATSSVQGESFGNSGVGRTKGELMSRRRVVQWQLTDGRKEKTTFSRRRPYPKVALLLISTTETCNVTGRKTAAAMPGNTV